MKRIYPHPFFAREGWTIMGAALILAIVVQLCVGGIVASLFWIVFLLIAQFFRDPARELPDDPTAVVAPVDGRVIKIEETVCPYTGQPTKMVSIFMSVFNVHSQKSPVSGKIERIEYFAGTFLNAAVDKASECNERNAMTVVTPEGWRVCFVQIAGLVARRILCYKVIGQDIAKGERYGFIRFGSRVDVYLPPEARLCVSIGDKTTGTASIIARLPEAGPAAATPAQAEADN